MFNRRSCIYDEEVREEKNNIDTSDMLYV